MELILYIGFITDPEIIWQKILEVSQMKHVIHEETWSFIDEFFREVPNAMDKLTTIQDALRVKLSKGKQQGIQQGMQQGMQQGIRRTLIRQLNLKFQKVPQNIIQIIQNTNDKERLDHWLDSVIIAKAINEIDFK